MISLEGSIRTCKVDQGWATKHFSDRYLNPSNMLCPPWQGGDTTGRAVCADSYWTKTPGCNSAGDRINVENALRPQYIEYVTLDAAGIQGSCDINPQGPRNSDAVCGSQALRNVNNYTGQFGLNTGFRQNIYSSCAPKCSNNQTDAAVGSNAAHMIGDMRYRAASIKGGRNYGTKSSYSS
jgi:hypothetical protein